MGRVGSALLFRTHREGDAGDRRRTRRRGGARKDSHCGVSRRMRFQDRAVEDFYIAFVICDYGNDICVVV